MKKTLLKRTLLVSALTVMLLGAGLTAAGADCCFCPQRRPSSVVSTIRQIRPKNTVPIPIRQTNMME